MKVAFICAPYRAATVRGIVENIRQAEAVAVELWKLGYAVICPHLNTALFDGILPDEVWLAGAQELLQRSDLVVVVGDYAASAGCNAELFQAIATSKPVHYWPDDRGAL